MDIIWEKGPDFKKQSCIYQYASVNEEPVDRILNHHNPFKDHYC